MPTTVKNPPNLASSLVNVILGIKPIAELAKHQAREMMIKRAGKIGVDWRGNVEKLKSHDWTTEIATVEDPNLKYPSYYVCSFHAYAKGNLDWEPAWEVESAALAVHATIWSDSKNPQANGDAELRQSYHQNLLKHIPLQPQNILDLGCSVGMSTVALQKTYPQAQITGLDLSPYYLAVAQYQARQQCITGITWKHAAAESTGLTEASFDLVSSFLTFHELPQKASLEILQEAYRLLRPGGYFAIMDMNPQSPIYSSMAPYILTLLKSTEPYLDEYFTLDIPEAFQRAKFNPPLIIPNSPRHRTIIAQKPL